MKLYDFEVFKYDWLVVFKDYETKEFTVFHNDYEGFEKFISDNRNELFSGFNIKHYDNSIVKAVLAKYSCEQIKQISDFILAGNNGWDHPLLKDLYFFFYSCDLRNDMQENLSLKSIEAHLGMDIEESGVDFNIDRPLTNEELEKTIFYCKHDVNAAEKLYEVRLTSLLAKIDLGAMRNINPKLAIGYTNAKLVAKYLLAEKVDRNDGRELQFPSALDLDVIPKEIIAFFKQIEDDSIPDKVLFKKNLQIDIGECPCVYSWGGGHGSYRKYYACSNNEIIIQNRDVSSLYPSLMILYEFLSRNCPSIDVFAKTRLRRLEAKHSGDKKTAQALKLPLNVTSGAMEAPSNDLYDPRQARNMRIAGQLFLTELIMKLLKNCKTFKLINFNTDGIMYEVNRKELHIVDRVCKEWENSTKFELETDNISKVWIKDVNNLMFVDDKGHIKTVGSYLNYGISEKGAWSINNNYVVVKKAIIEYFANNKPFEDTINECNNLLDFQMVASAGNKYSKPYQLFGKTKVELQRVNRVYASINTENGTIYKDHLATGESHKISEIPLHCIVDNNNKLTIDDINKKWYIKLAQKKINDFLGIPRPKVDKRKLNSLKKEILKLLEV